MNVFWTAGLMLIAVSVYLSVRTGKLTLPAALWGGLIALVLFTAFGYGGLALLGTFFALGVATTRIGKKGKQGLSGEAGVEKRTAGQVWANGGVAGLMGAWALVQPDLTDPLFALAAAAFSAAAADTVSSEIGTVYGRQHINILTGSRDKRGSDGVISLEGTLAGVAGSVIIAFIYALFAGFRPDSLFLIVAGTMGNLTDSVLGAALERSGRIGNNTVNFLNTAAGSIAMFFITGAYLGLGYSLDRFW